MKREFKQGDVIFHYRYWEPDLHGFGKVLKDTVAEDNDSIVLIEANRSGECETTADRIYKVKEHVQCSRCGCVVVEEWEGDIDYPYYCPDCDENMYGFETNVVEAKDWDEVLRDSIGRFLPPVED